MRRRLALAEENCQDIQEVTWYTDRVYFTQIILSYLIYSDDLWTAKWANTVIYEQIYFSLSAEASIFTYQILSEG